jgi:DUF4097 and DUF4098 domain-containing protein YvlB
MRITTTTLAAAAAAFLLISGPAEAISRTLTHERDGAGIREVSIEAGVGDIFVRESPTGKVSVRVEIRSKKAPWSDSGGGRSRRAVEKAELEAQVTSGTLHLEVDTPSSSNRGFEEEWTVELPRGTGLAIEAGVGDIEIAGVSGNVDVETGVGDLSFRGSDADFGDISIESGVGEIDLDQPGGKSSDDGIFGNDVTATGHGRSRLDLEVGVGDIEVDLK